MNTLSVEIQPCFSTAVLLEAESLSVIGDGQRNDIPNAFADVHWGTAALANQESSIIGNAPFFELYQHPGKIAAFLRGYFARATNFLGLTEPRHRNGYESVMVLHCRDFLQQAKVFREVARNEGLFTESQFIPADMAALANWNSLRTNKNTTHVLIVVIGELLTTVSLYQVPGDKKNTGAPVFISQAIIDKGVLHWLDEFGSFLGNSMEGQPLQNSILLYDHFIEFLQRIRHSRPAVIAWSGVYRQQLSQKAQLPDSSIFQSRHFSFYSFMETLSAVIESMQMTGKENQVIIAGQGALLPLNFEKLEKFGAITVAEDARYISLGGTRWPKLKAQYPSLANRLAY